MNNFYTDVIIHHPLHMSAERVSTLELLEPVTRAAVTALLQDAERQGIRLLVWETYRSRQRQEELFAKGATKLKTVGVHNYGLAADVVRNVDGKPSWEGDFNFMAPLAQKYKLISGLNWNTPGKHSFIDAYHVQRCSLRRQAELLAGTWYPGMDYDPYLDSGWIPNVS